MDIIRKAIVVVSIIFIATIIVTCSSPKKNILMIVTSSAGDGSGHETGYWGEELVIPYKIFENAGYKVTIASPKGGEPPLDEVSINTQTVGAEMKEEVEEFIATNKVLLEKSPKLSEINPNNYSAVFIVGGHGVIWDLVVDPDVNRIINQMYKKGNIVSAVCHGPAALVNVLDDKGEYVISGHNVTGFSISEETAANLIEYANKSNLKGQLEDRLKESGGKYEKGPDWNPFYVASKNVITGQNPASSEVTAKAVVSSLGSKGCSLACRR